jgi:hypothetical protein
VNVHMEGWRRSLAFGCTLGVALLASVAGVVPASAEAGHARIRFIDASVDVPSVDFYVDGQLVLSNVTYKGVSTYIDVAPGQHDLQARKSGSASSGQPLASTRQTLGDGTFSSVISVDLPDMSLGEVFFADGIASPPSGGAAMRFLHMCFQVPAVSIANKQDGKVLIDNISFMQGSPYTTVQSGTYDLELVPVGTNGHDRQPIYQVSGAALRAGSVQTFVGIGGMGQPVEMLEVLDAASAAVAPEGGAATGVGGQVSDHASAGLPGPAVGVGLLAFCLIAAASVLVLTRRATAAKC